MSKKPVTTEMVLKAYEASPQGFLNIDLVKPRSSKNSNNTYHTVSLMTDGKNRKLGVSWSNVALVGGVKPPEDRKYDPTLCFRKSSGELGDVLFKIYTRYAEIIETCKKDKTFTPKQSKAQFRTIIQDELEDGTPLEDPMIRLKLPFREGRAQFKVIQIRENSNGTLEKTNVKVTSENIHTIIRSGSITAGYVSMDSMVFSTFGVSIPAKVELLVIKPPEDDIPDVNDILDPSMMQAMAIKSSDDTEIIEEKKEEQSNETEETEETDETDTKDPMQQLTELHNLANTLDE
jgi:hypothetical protein